MYNNIPSEMKQYPNWCGFKKVYDEKRGKYTKIPINIVTGKQAKSNDPNTWCSFAEAMLHINKVDGLGFMFSNSPFLGVDLDDIDSEIEAYKCGDKHNIVYEFINGLGSYAEYSVSGKGIHIIAKGELPPQGRRKDKVEMYSEGRFFTVTGDIAAEFTDVQDVTSAIKPLHEKYIGGGNNTKEIIKKHVRAVNLSEKDILDKMFSSKQGNMARDLYQGNWKGYSIDQSTSDLSFCNILAFWCQCDFHTMDSIFRSSGLYRDKWDQKRGPKTYGEITLDKAITNCKEVYDPNFTTSTEEAKSIERKYYSADDTGLAHKFADLFSHVAKYNKSDNKWMYFDGRKWLYDNLGTIKGMQDFTIDDLHNDKFIFIEHSKEPEKAEKEFYKFIKKSRSHAAKNAMLSEAMDYTCIENSNLDTEKMIINTTNGILNLATGELTNHDSARLLSKITNVEYTDNADCPLWNKFLHEIFLGDQELINYIQKAVGYSLTGSTAEQCAFFCFGNGSNGKSVFLNIVSTLLGDYAINAQPETVMTNSRGANNGGGAATPDVARLKGARLVITVEPEEGVRIKEGLFKQLTGGDIITARRLYGNEFEFMPEFKMWCATNHKPIIRGTDDGIWRRIILIPFEAKFTDKQKDKNLTSKLQAELPGIFKWALEGCLKWQQEGLDRPEAIIKHTREYRGEMDVVQTFLQECTQNSLSCNLKTAELYRAYTRWATENNEYCMASRKFQAEITKKLSFTVERGVFKGIEFKDRYKMFKVDSAYTRCAAL